MPDHRANTRPAWQPTHPGAVLREEVLPALRISVTGAATALGVSRQTLHNILSERTAISPEMAVRLGKLCGNGPVLWLNLQQAHHLRQAERNLAETLPRIPTLRAA